MELCDCINNQDMSKRWSKKKWYWILDQKQKGSFQKFFFKLQVGNSSELSSMNQNLSSRQNQIYLQSKYEKDNNSTKMRKKYI